MRYLLDNQKDFMQTFVFWISKFAVNKIMTTSQRLVKDKKALNELVINIEDAKTIEDLKYYFKRLRSCGYQGLHIYDQPIFRLNDYLKKQQISSMKDIDRNLIIRFLTNSTNEFKNATKQNYRKVITNFFNYIDIYNYDENNRPYLYAFDLRAWEKNSIVPTSKIPPYLDEQELKEFLKALNDYKKTTHINYRNSFIIKLVLFTGLRSQELLDLKYTNIQEEDSFYRISVIGKGNKYREVLINKVHLEEYILNDVAEKEDYLFRNAKRERLSQAYTSKAVADVLNLARIYKRKKGTHLLRHTFATQLYRMKKDVVLVQNALGHSDLNTSMIYTHLDQDQLKQTTDIMNHIL